VAKKYAPEYVAGLTARNRLTDARDAVHRLSDHLPAEKHSEIARIYNQLCQVQGALEAMLEDVPTTIEVDDETHHESTASMEMHQSNDLDHNLADAQRRWDDSDDHPNVQEEDQQ
jgi:hypothetical protein